MAEQPTDEVAELRRTVERLQAELADLQEQRKRLVRRRRRLAVRGAGVGAYVALGPSLVQSLKNWLRATERGRPLPPDETAEVAAALIRRFLRVSLLALVVAVLPGAITGGLLVWQNSLIGEQVEQQTLQIEQQARDIEQRARDNLIARRAQLIDTLYSTEDCEKPYSLDSASGSLRITNEKAPAWARETGRGFLFSPYIGCPPRAHLRARQEAALAYLQIERDRGVRPDLSQADLAFAKLIAADLSGTILTGANLQFANLFSANLEGVDLSHADLGRAQLIEANLASANLTHSNLSSALLGRADFRGADLRWTDLDQGQLNGTRGDSHTRLPQGLVPPASWKEMPPP